MDRLDLAFAGTELAGPAAFRAALEPVEQARLGRDRQGRAQRAEVAAIDLAGEQVDHQQRDGVGDEPPLAVEAEGDGGLERLHLRGLLGQRQGFQGETEEHQQDDVLDRPEPLVHGERHLELRHAELAREFVEQFL